jgi:hypothetical protein
MRVVGQPALNVAKILKSNFGVVHREFRLAVSAVTYGRAALERQKRER